MTGQADGTVYINSKLDTSGFKPGSKEIEAACRRAANSVKGMGDAARIALEKQVNAFVKQNQMYAQQEQKVEDLKKKLEEMSKQKVATTAYAEVEKEISKLETALDKATQKQNKLVESGKATSLTSEYIAASKQVEKLDQALLRAYERKEKFLEKGGSETSGSFKNIEYDIEKLENQLRQAIADKEDLESSKTQKTDAFIALEKEIDDIKQSLAEANTQKEQLVSSGGAYQGVDTSAIEQKLVAEKERLLQMNNSLNVSFAALKNKIKEYGGSVKTLTNSQGTLRNAISSVFDAVKKSASVVGNATKKVFDSVGNELKKLDSIVNKLAKRIMSVFSKIGKSAKNADKGFSGISLSLKNILKYGFGIRSLYTLVNKMRSAIKEGFENLLTYSKELNDSVNGVKATALTMKNAFAAAFSPFVEIALPYVQKLLDYMIQLINVAGQFFAAITGRKTYIKAIKQTTAAIEKENAAMNKQLSGLDKLNNLTSQNADNADAGVGNMFEEVPIESGILDMAEKVKDILSKLFEPIKKAWEQEGQFVMDSWKYALEEVWKLIKDIGRDFLTVWREDETVAIFANILHIIGDIDLVVGNLARNFRAAWNENEVGLNILRNIRDVIGIIVQHIRNMADATVEWADKLNFYPILDAFKRFLDSIKPVVDAIWGIIEDFYTKVILPLAKWTVEKGLPDLLQVFIDFNNKVDWESLRKNIAELWEHLEPFAETVGEGLILFIRRVSDALADFLNSQEFKDFLKTIENWMDSVTPEDVANALANIAKGLIALKLALLGFSAIKAITGVLTTIKTFLSFFSVGGIASSIGTVISRIGIALKGLATAAGPIIASVTTALKGLAATLSGYVIPAILVAMAAVGGWAIGSKIAEELDLDPKPFKETMQEIKNSFTDGSWKEALRLWGEDIKEAFRLVGEFVSNDWNNSYMGQIKASFTDGSWKEALSLWKEDIVNAFITLKERTKEKFEEIKTNISNKLTEIKTKWSETWSGFKEKVTTVFGNIKTSIGSIFEWIIGKINSIITAIKGLSGAAKSLTTGGLGSALGNAFKGYSISVPNIQVPVASVPTIATANIPYLATGAVIPPNSPFVAVLGDQTRGNNLELPESLLRKVVREESGGMGGGDIVLNITAELDGEPIFNKMQKLDREFFKQNRRHAFA